MHLNECPERPWPGRTWCGGGGLFGTLPPTPGEGLEQLLKLPIVGVNYGHGEHQDHSLKTNHSGVS